MKTYTLQDLLFGEVEFEYNGEIKKYSFDGISIPLIQRDYAQGRKKEEVIRNRFIKSIFNALSNDEILELDFIYGSISKLNNFNYFQPLDGQQRLTTLYLLYWYIVNAELNEEESIIERNRLKRFSYETRSSSTLFCQKICDISFDGSPKHYIEESYWFHEEFKSDPTVIAMIEMLEKIHESYSLINVSGENYFDKLSNLKFYILPLDGFNLSDELYIKMNDRGKQLSHFENFKADFINWMKSENNKDYDKFNTSVVYKEMAMPYYLKIASKLDNLWSDYFWEKSIENIADSEIESSKLDVYFLNFINNFLLSELINNVKLKVEDTESFNFLYSTQSQVYKDWSNYENLFDYVVIYRLESFLDKLIQCKSVIKRNLSPTWKPDFSWFIDDLEISQINRILFHATYRYILNNDISEEKFKEWIRVVWNIISDPDIRSIPVMVNVMRVIDEMSAFSEDILVSLNINSLDNLIENLEGNFIQYQLIEEKNKSIFINEIPEEREERYSEIVEAEKHDLFQGNINFILEGVKTIDELKFNRSIAFDLFSKNGGLSILQNQEHVLFRYVISQLSDLDQIKSIYYRDDYGYWQLLLRRKEYEHVRNIITKLFNFSSINEVYDHLINGVNNRSTINEHNILHDNLYYNNDFHKWLQINGLDVLWDYSNHTYINRYRSSNDRVLIDNLRNELINKLVTELGFKCNSKCGATSFFKGKMIDCEKIFDNEIQITLKFYEDDRIGIGAWSGHNISYKFLTDEEDYWLSSEKIYNSGLDTKDEVLKCFNFITDSIDTVLIEMNKLKTN